VQTTQTSCISDWNTILSYIDDARNEYGSKGEKSLIRRKMREGENIAGLLDGLTKMIPDQNGLSVLRESLGYIFQVCGINIILISDLDWLRHGPNESQTPIMSSRYWKKSRITSATRNSFMRNTNAQI
jgi:hypothetical protein